MPLSTKMVTSEILMCGLKAGLKQIPGAGAGFDFAINLVEGLHRRHESVAHTERMDGLEAQVSRVERSLRGVVENEMRTILANMCRPNLPSVELEAEMNEFLQIQQQGWSPYLFDGLIRNSNCWQDLKQRPHLYGQVLDDHDPST